LLAIGKEEINYKQTVDGKTPENRPFQKFKALEIKRIDAVRHFLNPDMRKTPKWFDCRGVGGNF
jgi:hypothetical protein